MDVSSTIIAWLTRMMARNAKVRMNLLVKLMIAWSQYQRASRTASTAAPVAKHSQQARKMRDDLRLQVHSTRSVSPTQAGEQLLRTAAPPTAFTLLLDTLRNRGV